MSNRCEFMEYHRRHGYRNDYGNPMQCDGLYPPPPPPVPPGPCWHDSGITWPGHQASARCELLAGHAGAHRCDSGSLGGTAVWTDPA